MISTIKYSLIKLIIIICFLVLVIFISSPTTAYAMSPECFDDAYAINNSGSNGPYETPKDYWISHVHENDAYALHQKSIYLNNEGKIFYIEPHEYPFKTYSDSLDSEIPKTIILKSKFAWFAWKKYTNEFNSFGQYEESLNRSFSIRSELKKDIKRVFSKK